LTKKAAKTFRRGEETVGPEKKITARGSVADTRNVGVELGVSFGGYFFRPFPALGGKEEMGTQRERTKKREKGSKFLARWLQKKTSCKTWEVGIAIRTTAGVKGPGLRGLKKKRGCQKTTPSEQCSSKEKGM